MRNEKRAGRDEEQFSLRENYRLRTQKVPPGGDVMAGKQRSRDYGLLKTAIGSFTVAIQYSKGLNLILAICWNRSEDLSLLC